MLEPIDVRRVCCTVCPPLSGEPSLRVFRGNWAVRHLIFLPSFPISGQSYSALVFHSLFFFFRIPLINEIPAGGRRL